MPTYTEAYHNLTTNKYTAGKSLNSFIHSLTASQCVYGMKNTSGVLTPKRNDQFEIMSKAFLIHAKHLVKKMRSP